MHGTDDAIDGEAGLRVGCGGVPELRHRQFVGELPSVQFEHLGSSQRLDFKRLEVE